MFSSSVRTLVQTLLPASHSVIRSLNQTVKLASLTGMSVVCLCTAGNKFSVFRLFSCTLQTTRVGFSLLLWIAASCRRQRVDFNDLRPCSPLKCSAAEHKRHIVPETVREKQAPVKEHRDVLNKNVSVKRMTFLSLNCLLLP